MRGSLFWAVGAVGLFTACGGSGTVADAGFVCNASTCNGCCAADGSCQSGTAQTACGTGAETCATCDATTQACMAGSCQVIDAGAPLCAKTPSPCSDQAIQQLALKTTVAPGVITETTDGGEFDTVVDATGGGVSPTQSFVYGVFTSNGLVQLGLDDQSALDSTDWDIAFRRFVIRINGGTSGPSCDVAAAYPSTVTFDTAVVAPTATFASDETFTAPPDCTFVADGSGLPTSPSTALDNPEASFYTYTSCLKMTERVFAIQTRAGLTVKIVVTGYYSTPAAQTMCQAGTMPTVPGGVISLRWSFLSP